MQMALVKAPDRKPIGNFLVVRNFRRVIEARDISLMNRELYQFLNLYCGFIAHYDIKGFKAVYSPPNEFAEVFIRHFDREHRYFNGVYPCHEEPYKETGYTKAEIKLEFCRIVGLYKDAISKWADKKQRDGRYAVYLMLKKEFEGEGQGLKMNCEACVKEYEIK